MTGILSAVKITNVSQTATGLVASGFGVVNTTTGTIIAPFSNATLQPSGTCPILHLVIGADKFRFAGSAGDHKPDRA